MWKQAKLIAQLDTVKSIRDYVTVSGGLAWHLMSPEHEESKELHDHKDVDLFVIPRMWPNVVSWLKSVGFQRYYTKYDNTTPGFYRYGKSEEYHPPGKTVAPWMPLPHVKVLLDLFLEEVPFIMVRGFKVVEPKYLLSLYGVKHLSERCTAVKAARVIVSRGESPVGRPELLAGFETEKVGCPSRST